MALGSFGSTASASASQARASANGSSPAKMPFRSAKAFSRRVATGA